MAGMKNYANLKYASQPGSYIETDFDAAEAPGSSKSFGNHNKSPEVDRSFLLQHNLIADPDVPLSTSMKYINSEGNLSLSLDKHKMLRNDDDDYSQEDASTYITMGIHWVQLLTEHVLCHPFIVLRRQCQVYNTSRWYHVHPFGLFPVVTTLVRRQGVGTLWKGLGSCLLVRGMSTASDDIIWKLTGWPKQASGSMSFKRFGQHVMLKCLCIGIVAPFHAASLVETVQSDIASEKPGLFDVFREGSLRLVYWSSSRKGRMLPAWALIGPAVGVGITKYLFSTLIESISSRIMRQRLCKSEYYNMNGKKKLDDAVNKQNAEMYAHLIALVTTEVIFFPLETVLHRIQLQGTRTIIDSLDAGRECVPILTGYLGAFDCYRSILATEGVGGLYKGFGALVLQIAAHVAVIKLTRWAVVQITELLPGATPPLRFYNEHDQKTSGSATISPNLSLSDREAPDLSD